MNDDFLHRLLTDKQQRSYENNAKWLVKFDDGSWLCYHPVNRWDITVAPGLAFQFDSQQGAHEAGEAFCSEVGMDVTYETRLLSQVLNKGFVY